MFTKFTYELMMRKPVIEMGRNRTEERTQIAGIVLERIENLDLQSVLDVGCGRGELLQYLLMENPNLRACGIDLSERKIICAAERLNKKAQLTVGDAETLPYSDGSFDLLICGNSIRRCPNPARAINQFYRVLKVGGMLILYGSSRISAKRLLAGTVFRYGIDPVRRRSPQEIRNILEYSAFRNIKWETPARNLYLATGTK